MATENISTVEMTLKGFLQWALIELGDRAPYMFRGESALFDTPLTPTLNRYFTGAESVSSKDLLFYENGLWDEFRSKAYNYVEQPLLPPWDRQSEWWWLMHHYGVPTRLLSWSRSPLVAAYFACSQDMEVNGCVWFVDSIEIDKQTQAKYKIGLQPDMAQLQIGPNEDSLWQRNAALLREDAPSAVVIGATLQETSRIAAQQTKFTLCMNVATSQFDILRDELPELSAGGSPSFGKIIIKADEKPVYFEKLQALNANAHALFPGEDGLGRAGTDWLLKTVYARRSGRPTFTAIR
ncbi:MAG: FRG domain-containing protein [Gammaproteobacteria bacterium]|nr:MAG: FRG domain-containing protein [Gammaproteobacteria bacterium]TND06994.1 MAG: FRG domain-containing protein [Gammaproteobacteria bacterium]